MTLSINSSAFINGSDLPEEYTCGGSDISPALSWNGVPHNTKALVLIVDDPDAPDPGNPRMTWVHWVLYNIPPTAGGLPKGVLQSELLQATREGFNDWKRTGYSGPCPPIGRHRYFFKLYALDSVLPDLNKPTKAQLEARMVGHIIEQAEIIGTYERK